MSTPAGNGFFFLNVYFWERERDSMSEGRGRKRGRHRIPSRLQAPSCQHRARRGAQTHKLRDHDLSWSPTPNWLSHPGAPTHLSFHLNLWETEIFVIFPLLHVRNWQLREGNQLSQGYSSGESQSHPLNPDLLTPKFMLFPLSSVKTGRTACSLQLLVISRFHGWVSDQQSGCSLWLPSGDENQYDSYLLRWLEFKIDLLVP